MSQENKGIVITMPKDKTKDFCTFIKKGEKLRALDNLVELSVDMVQYDEEGDASIKKDISKVVALRNRIDKLCKK